MEDKAVLVPESYLDLIDELGRGAEDFRKAKENAERSEHFLVMKLQKLLIGGGHKDIPIQIRLRFKRHATFRWIEHPADRQFWSAPFDAPEGEYIGGLLSTFAGLDASEGIQCTFVILIGNFAFSISPYSAEIVSMRNASYEVSREKKTLLGSDVFPSVLGPWNKQKV